MDNRQYHPITQQQSQPHDKLKGAAMAQANSQSLGTYKVNEKDSNYGNFLIPILPCHQGNDQNFILLKNGSSIDSFNKFS